MATTEELLVQIKADSAELKREVAAANAALGKLSKDAQAASQRMSDGFGKAATALKGFITIAAVRQGFDMLYGALDRLDQIDETADKIGISAERLQELQYAAERMGSSSQTMTDALEKFGVQVGMAQNGTGKLKEVLDQYNISLRNTDGTLKNTEQLWNDFVRLMGETKNQNERLAISAGVLGKTLGPDLDIALRQGAAGFEVQAAAARKLGIIYSDEMAAQAGDAKDKLDDLRLVIQGELTRAIGGNAEAIGKWAVGTANAFNTVVDHAKEIKFAFELIGIAMAAVYGAKAVDGVIKIIAAMRTLNNVLKTQATLQAAIAALSGPGGWAKLAVGVAAAGAAVYALNNYLEDTEEALTNINEAAGSNALAVYNAKVMALQAQLKAGAIDAKKFAEEVQKADAARREAMGEAPAAGNTGSTGPTEDQKREAARIAEANRTIQEVYADGVKKAKELRDADALSEADYSREIARLGQERADALKAIADKENKLREDAIKKADDQRKAEQELADFRAEQVAAKQQETEDLIKAEEDYAKVMEERFLELTDPAAAFEASLQAQLQAYRELGYSVEELATIERARREEFASANASMTDQLLKNWGDVTKQMDLATSSWINGSADALTDFVMNGKADFKELANSIIRDLVRIMIQQMIVNAIGGALGGMFGSGAGGVAMNGLDPSLVGLGRAAGGPVNPNRVYPVGERGPELFVPPSVGKIVPASGMNNPGSVRVEVINKGTPQEAMGSDVRFDAKGMVVSIITDDIRRNGPISSSMTQAFGMRRMA